MTRPRHRDEADRSSRVHGVVTADGTVHSAGDVKTEVSIQSI